MPARRFRKMRRWFKKRGRKMFKRRAVKRSRGPLRKSTGQVVIYKANPDNRFAFYPNTYYCTMRMKTVFSITDTIAAGDVSNYRMHPNDLIDLLPDVTPSQGAFGLDEFVVLYDTWYVAHGRTTIQVFPETDLIDTSQMVVSMNHRADTSMPSNQQGQLTQNNAITKVMITNVVKPTFLSQSWNSKRLFSRNTSVDGEFFGRDGTGGVSPTNFVFGTFTLSSSSLTDTTVSVSGIIEMELFVKFSKREKLSAFPSGGEGIDWTAQGTTPIPLVLPMDVGSFLEEKKEEVESMNVCPTCKT